jgi:hypothetical protein
MKMNVWIFESSSLTHHECLSLGLFGARKNWPLQVKKGDVCFLYNYTEKMIHGVWFADSDGGRSLEPGAWNGAYPFQVRVKRAGTTMQIFPKANVWRFICQPDSGYVMNRLQNDRAHNLLQHFAHVKHEAVVFEREFDSVEQDYRRKYPAEYTTQDGHHVRSKSEVIIDDYLYSKGIPHAYEPVIFCGNQKLIPDFLVKNSDEEDVCIEYWGMLDDEAYRARMEIKKKLYVTHHIRVIDITDSDLRSSDMFVQQKLRNQKIKTS